MNDSFTLYSKELPIFSAEELDQILDAGLGMKDGQVGEFVGVSTIRRSQVCWLDRGRFEMFYERIWALIVKVNRSSYGFDIDTLQPLQLARYDASDAGFYGWHMDSGPGNSGRKISLSLQLSPEESYGGGELELFLGGRKVVASQDLGAATTFSSFVVHRVRPVTRGVRYSLVGWATGPPLR